MVTGPALPMAAKPAEALTQEQFTALARTYDTVEEPIWILDRTGTAIYRNRHARRLIEDAVPGLTFNITDHRGRVLACLAMRTP